MDAVVAKISSMLFKILTKFRQNYDKNMGVSADIIQVTFTIPTGWNSPNKYHLGVKNKNYQLCISHISSTTHLEIF